LLTTTEKLTCYFRGDLHAILAQRSMKIGSTTCSGWHHGRL